MSRIGLLAAVFVLAMGCGASDAGDRQGPDSGPTSSDASSTGDSGTNLTTDGASGNGVKCSAGYSCYGEPGADLVWVMKNDGNLYGPTCTEVCANGLSQNCAYHACDDGRAVQAKDIASFAPIAAGLGFKCRPGGCWSSVSPVEGAGLYLVSINTDATDSSKACYFPSQTQLSCSMAPGNANCFGERYSSVCPCVPKALDQACTWQCGPNNTTRAVWKTAGTSCLERINYWRKKACTDGWVECPPAGLPPMVECTACHQCSNSEAEFDSKNGAHASFTRCGELVQGEGGGATCADVIDAFVSERAPDANGIMRCAGHCGPIVAPGCRTFSWGRAKSSDFHTLNWDLCNVNSCQSYCTNQPADCFTVATSPSMTCDNPDVGSEPGPAGPTCP